MNRRSLLGFFSLLPFASLLKRKTEAVAIPNLEDDINYWLHKVEYTESPDAIDDLTYWRRKVEYYESIGDHKKAELYRKRVLLLEDAALIYAIQRARNGREFRMHIERVGQGTFCCEVPADLSPEGAMKYLDSVKRQHKFGCYNA